MNNNESVRVAVRMGKDDYKKLQKLKKSLGVDTVSAVIRALIRNTYSNIQEYMDLKKSSAQAPAKKK